MRVCVYACVCVRARAMSHSPFPRDRRLRRGWVGKRSERLRAYYSERASLMTLSCYTTPLRHPTDRSLARRLDSESNRRRRVTSAARTREYRAQ